MQTPSQQSLRTYDEVVAADAGTGGASLDSAAAPSSDTLTPTTTYSGYAKVTVEPLLQSAGTGSGTGTTTDSITDVTESTDATDSEPKEDSESVKHVDNLATGIAGAVMSAPLAAVEHFSPAVSAKLSNAGSVLSGHASNLSSTVQAQATNLSHNETAQSYASQATALAQQAKQAVLNSLPASLGGNAANPSITDTGRQGAVDSAEAKLKPDSQKTYTEQASDYVKGTADNAASYIQPDSDKSLGQSAKDTFQSGSSSSTGLTDSNKPYTEQASDYLQDTADQAASYVPPNSNKSVGQSFNETFDTGSSSATLPGVTSSSRESAWDSNASNLTSDSYTSDPQQASDFFQGKDASASYAPTSQSTGQSFNETYGFESGSTPVTLPGVTDSSRQGAWDSTAASLKPDYLKTDPERASDFFQGKVDSAASYLEPESQKSTGQYTKDAVFGDNTTRYA